MGVNRINEITQPLTSTIVRTARAVRVIGYCWLMGLESIRLGRAFMGTVKWRLNNKVVMLSSLKREGIGISMEKLIISVCVSSFLLVPLQTLPSANAEGIVIQQP